MEEDKVFQIYEVILENGSITTKEIKELGFSQNDITKLVSEGKLIRVKRGYYEWLDLEDIYLYAKYLINTNNRDKGLEVLSKVFEMDNTNPRVAFQLFLECIKKQDYEKAFKYFDVLYDYSEYKNRTLYYLYMLSFITDIPDEYKEVTRTLNAKDLFMEVTSEYDKSFNRTVSLLFDGKLPYALSTRMKFFSDNNQKKLPSDYVETTLLRDASSHYKVDKVNLDNLIKEEKYEEALEIINKWGDSRELTIYYKYISYLINDLIRMVNFGEVHDVKEVDYVVNNLFNAIELYDYDVALNLAREHSSTYKNNVEDSMIVLLSRLVELKKIKTNKVEEVSDAVEEVKEEQQEEVVNISYSELTTMLLTGNIEGFKYYLYDYLEANELLGYYKCLLNMLELDDIYENYSYSNTLVALLQIVNGTYVFDEKACIKEYYIAIRNNEFNIARLHYDLLCALSNLNDELLEEIYKVLEVIENNNVKNVVEQVSVEPEVEVKPVVQNVVKEEKVEKKPEVKVKRTVLSNDEYDKEVRFISGKVEQLVESHGIILLRTMDEDRIECIHNIVKKMDNVRSFTIGSENNRRVVLRYTEKNTIPIKETIKKSDAAYYTGDYKTALEGYMEVLATNQPKTFIYAKVGLTLMKMWKLDAAIEYLTVATEISKGTGENYDFSDLIASLNGTLSPEDKKPKVNFKLEEFEDEDSFGVGLDRINYMLEYKDVNEVDYETACNECDFTYDEYLLTLLILARRNYINKTEEIAERLLKIVEKAPNKSKKVLTRMQEIMQNKTLYKNKKVSDAKKLV